MLTGGIFIHIPEDGIFSSDKGECGAFALYWFGQKRGVYRHPLRRRLMDPITHLCSGILVGEFVRDRFESGRGVTIFLRPRRLNS